MKVLKKIARMLGVGSQKRKTGVYLQQVAPRRPSGQAAAPSTEPLALERLRQRIESQKTQDIPEPEVSSSRKNLRRAIQWGRKKF